MDKESSISTTLVACPKCDYLNGFDNLRCDHCGETLHLPKEGEIRLKKRRESPKEVPTKEGKVTKPRRKRARKITPTDIQFFILEGSKLKAVNIQWGVIRPMKRSSLSKDAKNVLSLYNRSKDLLK